MKAGVNCTRYSELHVCLSLQVWLCVDKNFDVIECSPRSYPANPCDNQLIYPPLLQQYKKAHNKKGCSNHCKPKSGTCYQP